jgi:hypothetical protein
VSCLCTVAFSPSIRSAPFYAAAYVHVQAAAHNARLETEVPTFADLRYFILLE